MKDLTNLKADFRDWLTLPLTKTFMDILTAQKQTHLDFANHAAFKSYYKKELSEQATLAYGKVDGIDTILSLMETCKYEEPVTEITKSNDPAKEREEVITYPIIDALFQQTFEPEND